MAITDTPTSPGRTLLLDALAQSDVDMQFHRFLNLDMSNFPPMGIPPTVHPPSNQWLHDWDSVLQQWTSTQPTFPDISGFLTGPQMTHIDQLGRVRVGTWQADAIAPAYLPTLDQIRAPQANVDLNGNRLSGVAPPINPNDAVNLAYMDFLLQGLQPKEAVRVATTSANHTGSGNGPIDGITLVAGDRILLKNPRVGREYEGGIYKCTGGGLWTREPDADTATELLRAYCTVKEGTINAGTSWVQIADLTEPLGIDDFPNWVLFSAAPILNILAGSGLSKVGNTLNVVGTAGRIAVGTGVNIDPAYLGQNSITTLGVVTAGTWAAGLISSSFGGTGVNNNDHTLNLGGISVAFSQIGTAVPDNNLLIRVPAGITQIDFPALGRIATTDQVETFTNKRINPRTGTLASNAAPPINIDLIDMFTITALAVNIPNMSAGITGTPVDGQELILWLKDNGTSRTIAWGTLFDASTDLPLPTATTASKWYVLHFVYNLTKAKWVLTVKLNNIS